MQLASLGGCSGVSRVETDLRFLLWSTTAAVDWLAARDGGSGRHHVPALARQLRSKKKGIGVVQIRLALFVSSWTCVYTYQQQAAFAANLLVTLNAMALSRLVDGVTPIYQASLHLGI